MLVSLLCTPPGQPFLVPVLVMPDWRPPWCENSPMIALPGLISRRDKSPTSRNSEVVPCSSQQLNSRCGQNGSLSIASRTCGGRGSGVVVGKLLKFYIEFNCLDHERIASGFKCVSYVRIGSRAPKTLVRLFKPIVWSRSVLHEYDELMPEALSVP
jgi:hypothetical protein